MLLKIFGGLDVISGFILLFSAIGFKMQTSFFLFFGIVIIGKSLFVLLQDVGSWIDLFVGVVLLMSVTVIIPEIVLIIAGLAILQKGVASFL